MYYRFKWGSQDLIATGYGFWDHLTHSGVAQYGVTTGSMNIDDVGSNYDIYVYGSLDFVIGMETLEDTYDQACSFGILDNDVFGIFPNVCSSDILSGTDVVVTLDNIPPEWVAGTTRVLFWYKSTVESTPIKAINGNDITVDLVNGYAAGAIVRERTPYCVNNATASPFTYVVLHNHIGATAGLSAPALMVSDSYLDPESVYGEYFMFPLIILGGNNYFGTLPKIYSRPSALTDKTTYVTEDATYRCIKVQSNMNYAFLEV